MQADRSPATINAANEAAPARPAADVPSDQLWREAIRAARQAARSAAELRRAIEASRADAPPGSV